MRCCPNKEKRTGKLETVESDCDKMFSKKQERKRRKTLLESQNDEKKNIDRRFVYNQASFEQTHVA